MLKTLKPPMPGTHLCDVKGIPEDGPDDSSDTSRNRIIHSQQHSNGVRVESEHSLAAGGHEEADFCTDTLGSPATAGPYGPRLGLSLSLCPSSLPAWQSRNHLSNMMRRIILIAMRVVGLLNYEAATSGELRTL